MSEISEKILTESFSKNFTEGFSKDFLRKLWYEVSCFSQMQEMRYKIKKVVNKTSPVLFPLSTLEKKGFLIKTQTPHQAPVLVIFSMLQKFLLKDSVRIFSEISDMKWLFWAKWRKWGPKSKKESIRQVQFCFLYSFFKTKFFFHQHPDLQKFLRIGHF